MSLYSCQVSNECKSTTEFANTITLAVTCIHAYAYCFIIMLSYVYCSCDKIKCIIVRFCIARVILDLQIFNLILVSW